MEYRNSLRENINLKTEIDNLIISSQRSASLYEEIKLNENLSNKENETLTTEIAALNTMTGIKNNIIAADKEEITNLQSRIEKLEAEKNKSTILIHKLSQYIYF